MVAHERPARRPPLMDPRRTLEPWAIFDALRAFSNCGEIETERWAICRCRTRSTVDGALSQKSTLVTLVRLELHRRDEQSCSRRRVGQRFEGSVRRATSPREKTRDSCRRMSARASPAGGGVQLGSGVRLPAFTGRQSFFVAHAFGATWRALPPLCSCPHDAAAVRQSRKGAL